MNCKPGDLAVIVRPWEIDQDIGKPVSVIRLSRPSEVGETRGGGRTTSSGCSGAAWLCDASGPGFPCFIADICLRPFKGRHGADETLAWAGLPADAKSRETEGVPT